MAANTLKGKLYSEVGIANGLPALINNSLSSVPQITAKSALGKKFIFSNGPTWSQSKIIDNETSDMNNTPGCTSDIAFARSANIERPLPTSVSEPRAFGICFK